ncbi:MAG: porin [Hydrogenophilaceae bacterium]|nr:porin [Hydrogenophilaceae bacterium]
MQKKLIALAVAGLVAAPAFAATSNVDVYGQLDFSVNYVNGDVTGACPTNCDDSDMVTGKSNASRIGFKGSEDLGGGMKALWQVETEFLSGSNNNTATYGSLRNTFVGLGGGFGTVLMGRHDTPYKLATGKLDIFADSIGDYNAIIGAEDGVFGSSVFDLRVDQTVAYITPTFSGFHGAIAYVSLKTNEPAAADKDQDAWSVMGMYDNSPLFASVAYEVHNGMVAAGTTVDADAWKVGLGYTFGNAKIGAIYESQSEGGAAATATDHSAWWLGGQYTMGNIVLKGAYGNRDDSDVAGADDGGEMWALGVDYNLSKRTKAYIIYASTDNDTAGNTVLFGTDATNNGTGFTAGNSASIWSVGVRHSF